MLSNDHGFENRLAVLKGQRQGPFTDDETKGRWFGSYEVGH